MHVVTALAASWRKKTAIVKAPQARGALFFSSVVICAFIAIHVNTFRFGPGVKDGYSQGNVRDLAKLQREVFSDPTQLLFYLFSLCAIGIHVWLGWTKAVPKLEGLPKEHREWATIIGQVMTVALVIGFSLGPLHAYSSSHSQAAVVPEL